MTKEMERTWREKTVMRRVMKANFVMCPLSIANARVIEETMVESMSQQTTTKWRSIVEAT